MRITKMGARTQHSTSLQRASCAGPGLLGAGADVHAKDEAGRTALELAKDDATFEALKAGGTTMSDMTQ